MSSDMTVSDALDLCDEILENLDDIPVAGEEFADSVREGVESVREWIGTHDAVTDKQATALENWAEGVGRWLRGNR